MVGLIGIYVRLCRRFDVGVDGDAADIGGFFGPYVIFFSSIIWYRVRALAGNE